jgi:hypothetical protein
MISSSTRSSIGLSKLLGMGRSEASIGEVWAFYFSQFGKYIFVGNHMWFTVTLFTFSSLAASLITGFRSWQKFVFAQHSLKSVSQKAMMLIMVKMSLILIVLNYLLRIAMPDGYAWIPV